jgi:PAS domain-containing protein
MTCEWLREFPGAVTVCDPTGIILEMNERAIKMFDSDGGSELIGRNVLDCHPEPARSQLREMLATERRNVYTIEKNGRRKLLYQTPWYQDGVYAGFVELALELPADVPHFVRKP